MKLKNGLAIEKFDDEIISIPIDSLTPPAYNIFSYDKKDDILVGYNPMIHSLDFFSIKDERQLNRIFLEKEGPNQVQTNIVNLVFSDKDKVAFYSQNYFYEYDFKNDVLDKREINQSNLMLFGKYHTQFSYNSITEKYYLPNTDYSISQSQNPQEYYSRKGIISEYDFGENKMEQLEVAYPELFKTDFYGFNDMLSFALDENKGDLYIGFAAYPGLLTYQIENGKTNHIPFTDKITENLKVLKMNYGQSEAFQDQFKNRILGANYGTVHSLDDYWLVTAVGNMPEIGMEDYTNSQEMKKNYVILIEKNTGKSTKIELATKIGLFNIFSEENSFYSFTEGKENEMMILKFTFEKSL